MGAVNLDRDELQGLLESPETRQRVRKLLELQYRKDSEVGGELYLRGRSRDSLFFRVIPSAFEYLIEYVRSDLARGVYNPRIFSKLKKWFQGPDCPDRLEISTCWRKWELLKVAKQGN
ncbi:MAG TPA: hypothetical protein VJB06_02460 [archaeon]|nr:hypothetical protein [archaeon]